MEIRLDNISKRFGEKTVLHPLSLIFPAGQFTTLLGPSGCGKTTLLRIIAGLETPDSGQVWLGDQLVFCSDKGINLPPETRGLGFVFQDFALWPHLTVFENVAFGLRARGQTEGLTARVREALHSVQLEEYEKRLPHQLSGGQQQRVAFARAMVIRPKCILFDEPLSALDALLRVEMRAELKQLTQSLMVTSVFVTHDQEEAMSLSDQIAVMQEGVVLQYDRPQTIYARPATPFVAQFVGKSNWIDKGSMLRPEHLSLADQAEEDALPMTVSAIQYLGHGYQLTLTDPQHTWQVFTPTPMPVGSLARVKINREHIINL